MDLPLSCCIALPICSGALSSSHMTQRLLLLPVKYRGEGGRVQGQWKHTAWLGNLPARVHHSSRIAIGAHGKEGEQRVLAGDSRKGDKRTLCAILLHRAGKYNFYFMKNNRLYNHFKFAGSRKYKVPVTVS